MIRSGLSGICGLRSNPGLGPRRSLVAGKVRRPIPVPHVHLTRGGASRAGPLVGELLRDAHSASSSGARGLTGARTAGLCTPAESVLVAVLGELPAEEGEAGRPAAIARVEVVLLSKVQRRRAVRSHWSTLLLLLALLPAGLRCTVLGGHSA